MGTVVVSFFSGTGNSYSVADALSQRLSAKGNSCQIRAMVSTPPGDLRGTDLLCFVFPVYALTLPNVVRKYLKALPKGEGYPKVALVVTEGAADEEGWSLVKGKRIVEQRGYQVIDADAVPMPVNWTTVMRSQDPEERQEILSKAKAQVRRIADRIAGREGVYLKEQMSPPYGWMGSTLMKLAFPRWGRPILGWLFHADKACDFCKKCIRVCPVQAIKERKTGPRWTARCEQCMRCVNTCPRNAIVQADALLHGKENPRYFHPGYRLDSLVKMERVPVSVSGGES